jgi:hypothetical protein
MVGGIKKKLSKICTDIQEANHAMKNVIRSNRYGDQNNIPWLLIKKQINCVK